MRVLLLLFLSAFAYSGFGQNMVKGISKRTSASFAHRVMEPQEKISGILLLLPGLGEKPKYIFQKTSLPALLAEHGFLTIVPELGKSIIADKYAPGQVAYNT